MRAVREIVARGVPLDRSDVDTDQIIQRNPAGDNFAYGTHQES